MKLHTALFAMSLAVVSGAALAQSTPAVNEVDQRLNQQQNRIDAGVANGTITANQATHDENHDARIANRASADEAANGGKLTPGETHRLNRSLRRGSRQIHRQRAE